MLRQDKKTITLNGYAYRSKELLESVYNSDVEVGWFTKNSDYTDIITHEFGHVLFNLNKPKYSNFYTEIFGTNKYDEYKQIIRNNISDYAIDDFKEVIAESFVMHKNHSDNQYVKKLFDYTHLINGK